MSDVPEAAAAPREDLPEHPVRVLAGGFLMGLANLVPGVSGGTMILALGLYDRFIGAVAELSRLRFRRRTLAFVVLLVIGLAAAILALSGPAVWLVRERRWIAYSLFIGMTLGGVPTLWRLSTPLRTPAVVGFLAGLAVMLVFAFGLGTSALLPSFGILVGAGAAASASMILPGISGSYVLLVLGLYDVVWSAVRPASLRGDLHGSLAILVPTAIGVAIGIGAFSNVLRILLQRWSRATHAVLLGLLIGSVAGLWPFQEATHPLLGTKPGVEAVQRLLEGEDPAAIESATGFHLSAAEATEARSRYAGSSRGDLKRLGLELETFPPTALQVLAALGLLVGGFLVTRLLGVEEPDTEHA